MTSFVTRMPQGFVGQVTRDPQVAVIETLMLAASSIPAAFGLPVQSASGVLNLATAVANVKGFLVRSYPRQSSTDAFGSDAPVISTLGNRIRSGYFMAQNLYGASALDGIVYMRVDTGGNGGVVGALEATSDTTHNAAIPGCFFMGPTDANNLVEVAYNI